MSKQNSDGGPAFPIPNDDRPGAYEAHPGMSLRDWFAGQALSIAVNKHFSGLTMQQQRQAEAELAYAVADAMLAERAKP